MVWERIKRWFSGGSESPPPKEDGGLSSLPDIPWLKPADNPWGIPVLDVRPVTLGLISASKSPEAATNNVLMGRDDGTRFIGAQPLLPRRTAANLRFRVDPLLPDGVLFPPRQMEHKWGLYLYQRRILFVRSWTCQVHAIADVEHQGDTLLITHVSGAFSGEDEPPELTVRVLDFLLRSHVLQLEHPAPLPPGMDAQPKAAAMWCMSLFGNMAHFATPAPLSLPSPEKVLRTSSLLHIAAARGDLRAVEQQLDAGAPLTALAVDGLAPLHWALVGSGGTALLSLLLARGSPVDVRSAEGATPLMNAVQKGRSDQVAWLLEHGADPNATDDRGFTALHRAAELGQADAVRLLLARGARPDTAAQGGHTPRSLALSRQHDDIVQLLGG